MVKVIAIGDIHGMWEEVWKVLRVSHLVDEQGLPTEALRQGRYRVVFIGDLVHYKDLETYNNVAGVARYDSNNPEHLQRAARAQIDELYRFKTFADACGEYASLILGNHDEDALTHDYGLATRGGIFHNEVNEDFGGIPIPDDLHQWMLGFKRQEIIYNVHFAHAGPLPMMQYFDDFFYNDRDSKHWWHEKPFYMEQTNFRFGVYGHTSMDNGIHIDREHNFAMIDALSDRQYLEMIIGDERLDYRVMQF